MANALKNSKLLELRHSNGEVEYYNPQNRDDIEKLKNITDVKNIRVFFSIPNERNVDFSNAFSGANFSNDICVDLTKLITDTQINFGLKPKINFFNAFSNVTFGKNQKAILCKDNLLVNEYKLNFSNNNKYINLKYFPSEYYNTPDTYPTLCGIFGSENNNVASFDYETFKEYNYNDGNIYKSLVDGNATVESLKNLGIPDGSLFFAQLIVGFSNSNEQPICVDKNSETDLSSLYNADWRSILNKSNNNQFRITFDNSPEKNNEYFNKLKYGELFDTLFKLFGYKNSWIKGVYESVINESERSRRKYYLSELNKILGDENDDKLLGRIKKLLSSSVNDLNYIELKQFTTIEEINDWTYKQRQEIIDDINLLLKIKHLNYIEIDNKYLYDKHIYKSINDQDDDKSYKITNYINNELCHTKINSILQTYKKFIEEKLYTNLISNAEQIRSSMGKAKQLVQEMIAKLNNYKNGENNSGKKIPNAMNIKIEYNNDSESNIIFSDADQFCIPEFNYGGIIKTLNDTYNSKTPDYILFDLLFDYVNHKFNTLRVEEYCDDHYLDDDFTAKIIEILIERTSQFYDYNFSNIQSYWVESGYSVSNLSQNNNIFNDVVSCLTSKDTLDKIDLLYSGISFRKYDITSSEDLWDSFVFDINSYANGKNLIITKREDIVRAIYNAEIEVIKNKNSDIEQIIKNAKWEDNQLSLNLGITNNIYTCCNYNGDEIAILLNNVQFVNCFSESGELSSIVKDLSAICVQTLKFEFETRMYKIDTDVFFNKTTGNLLTFDELTDIYLTADDQQTIFAKMNQIIDIFDKLQLIAVNTFNVKDCYNVSDTYYQLYNLLYEFVNYSNNESIASTIEIETE